MLRKSLAALAALVFAVMLAPVAHAQTLDEIMAKHYEAQGGLAHLQAMKSVRLTGKMEVGPGMEAPIILEKKRPGMMRMEFTFQGMTGISAYDGAQGWQVMPFMGKKDPEAMSPDDAKEVEQQADFDGPLVDWKAKGNTLELIGKESVEGAETWKLKLTRKSGQVEFYFIDTETYLILKETAKRTVRGTEVEGESMFSDYKEVDGLMFPHSMTNGMVGSERKQTMSFDKIEVNPALDDARFHMPAAAAAADSAAAAPAKPAAKPVAAPAKPIKK